MEGGKRCSQGKWRIEQFTIHLETFGLRVDAGFCLDGLDAVSALDNELHFRIAGVVRPVVRIPSGGEKLL